MKGLYYYVLILLDDKKEIIKSGNQYWVFSYATLSNDRAKLTKDSGENIFGVPCVYQLTIPAKRIYESDTWLLKYVRNYLDNHEIDFEKADNE